ncbi:centromere protein S-like [Plodia interpunctella]|uniref:centromere protein S-like n=1 Tax=Plodia interpunctella TaxID=58824 RepID=UPI00236828ED|nr:centromere protein S-like [Plodia interpunctella]
MTTFENLSPKQKVRVSLHRDIRTICTETCHLMGLDITKSAMEIVSELVYKKLIIYGTDLEAFAKHAKRTVINADDVKLLVRRNPSLKTHLNANQPAAKDKRRKTVTPASKPETPAQKTTDKDGAPDTSRVMAPKVTKENTAFIETSASKQDDQAFEHMDITDAIDLTFDD